MKEKNIYCPQCGRKVMHYDGKAESALKVKCLKCKFIVTYFPKQNFTKISRIPPRTSSSGIRFY